MSDEEKCMQQDVDELKRQKRELEEEIKRLKESGREPGKEGSGEGVAERDGGKKKSKTMDLALRNAVQMHVADMIEDAVDQANERPRTFHDRDDPFDLSERQFLKLFRFDKNGVNRIIDIVEQYSDEPSRSSALDASLQVLTALRFFASGSYQLDIGQNVNMAVSQSSVSRCIHKVINILTQPEVFDTWVRFPDNIQSLSKVRNRFWTKHHFPGAVGCIDCTHVAIFPPPREDENFPEHIYVNRKGYHSINVQLICDADLRIMNVNARFPGSTHDNYIWNNSGVLPLMRNLYNRQHRFVLLGDSGYALRPWMMVPILDAGLNISQNNYNECQMSTRSVIERCNGLLKMRFRCLLKHRVLHYAPDVCSKIINTCVVLHNMCVHDNIPHPDAEEGDEQLDFGLNVAANYDQVNLHGQQRGNPDLTAGRQIRDTIIRRYFT